MFEKKPNGWMERQKFDEATNINLKFSVIRDPVKTENENKYEANLQMSS